MSVKIIEVNSNDKILIQKLPNCTQEVATKAHKQIANLLSGETHFETISSDVDIVVIRN